MPAVLIREGAGFALSVRCKAKHSQDIAHAIGVHPSQASRVLSGKNPPGNQFIAGVILRFGLRWAFDHVFWVAS
jgi:hypothetical protein